MSIDMNRADELIDAAQQGQALKVEKPRDESPPLKLEIADPTRPAEANINRQPTMSHAEAMALLKARKLERPVLTEQGWVTLNRGAKNKGSEAA